MLSLSGGVGTPVTSRTRGGLTCSASIRRPELQSSTVEDYSLDGVDSDVANIWTDLADTFQFERSTDFSYAV